MKMIILLFIFFTLYLNANEQVDLYLKWKHQFQFAGYYMAKEKGFYKDAGLDVAIYEHQHDVNVLKSVIAKEGIYAIGYPSIVLDRANGADIVLLAAIYQISPHVLLSLKSSNIRSVKDFKNKTIMINQDATKTVSFIAMMKANHIGFRDLTRVEPTFSIDPLVNGKIDITTAFLSNEPYALSKRGIKYDVWDPKDYGFDFYDDILYTSKNELLHHPQRVKSFLEATLKGWKYAFEHQEESVEIILQKYNSQHRTKEALLYEAKVLKSLACIDGINLGDLDLKKIKRILDLYSVLGLVKQKVEYNNFIYNKQQIFFTKQEKEYLTKKGKIKVCVNENLMPLEAFENGKYIGLSADFFKILSRDLSFKFIATNSLNESLKKIKSKECDIISLASSSEKRKKYVYFLKPYLNNSLFLVTRESVAFIDNIKLLKNKKIGVIKGYALKDKLQKKYPNLQIIELDNINDGFTKVSSKELYGYIDTLATIGYKFSHEAQRNLKISAKLELPLQLGIAVNKDDSLLFNIMQKLMQKIDINTKEMIINRWITFNVIEKTDYRLVFEIVIAFFIFFAILFFFYLKEKVLKQESQKKSLLLDAIINTVSEPMFYKNIKGIYENVNSAFSHKVLNAHRDAIIGKTLYDLKDKIPQKLLKIYLEQDKKLFQERKNQTYEAQVKLADGSIRDFRIQKNIVWDNQGIMLGYVAVMYDISDLKEKERYLEELASKDQLTKLYNRRYFIEIGTSLIHLAQREKVDLSLMMLDIDNFKKVNDTYGHDVGDIVLQTIAKTMNSHARESDIIARWGGEEFIFILPKTSKEGALVVAQKLCNTVEKTKINFKNGELFVTVSIGVSTLIEKDSLDTITKRADNALYKAKNGGKNQVRFE